MNSLTEEQKGIISYFEDMEQGFQQTGVNEMYMKGSEEEGATPEWREWMDIPLMNEIQFEPEYEELRVKLKQYKKRSKLVQEVGTLMHEFKINFEHMLGKRKELMDQISIINRQTSDLVCKQKKYIDLSMAVKEALDYYSSLDNFQFQWACEVSCRDMFEDQLQPILSELTDSIEFFSENINYSSAKKYLSGLAGCRTKVMSFTKSFFIKLLNKEYSFAIKHSKPAIWKCIDSFYPKSKSKFLMEYISVFPQFKKNLRNILISAKESISEADANQMEAKEFQIEEFELNDSSLSLIGYLQNSIPDIYEEVILKFVSYYRVSFHEDLHKSIEVNKEMKYTEAFREMFTQVVFILTSEAAYLAYLFRPHSQVSFEYAHNILTKISEFYSKSLVQLARDPQKNKDPFLLCNEVTYCLEETDKFYRNYLTKQYQTYVMGAVIEHVEELGVDFLKNLIQAIGNKVKHELEPACQNFLPKFKPEADRSKVTEQVREFVNMIPNLKYCPGGAEKYLVSSLDTIIKSVREANQKIQSRLECYAWDLEIFTALQENLLRLPYNLTKKETRLDMNEATTLIDKVKSVNRSQNWLKYASDIFTVIKTGVPTLNELTLDFNKFVREYLEELRDKFLRDMVFVHAKNIIEFMQKLKDASNEAAVKLCEPQTLKSLHSGYVLSIENFIGQAKMIMKVRDGFCLHPDGENELRELLKEVEESLVEVMSSFYIESSKHCSETQKFEPISVLRSRLKQLWQ